MEFERACAVFGRAPNLTAEHLHAFVRHAGTLEDAVTAAVHAAPEIELPQGARGFLEAPDFAAIDADLAWAEASGAHLIPCTSPEYPPLLARTERAPCVLYVLGDVPQLSAIQLAIVGSRNPTPGGRATAREFAEFFARCGLIITSGLALGIDGAAHEGALEAGGATIAVCGCGLDQVYPKQHAALAARIREQGALISEFPPGTEPLPSNFPRRNRIISGLSIGTLVVEAARNSGSLITAKHALDQGREVFAIPGSIHNPLARGCHHLIRQGAKLVESAEDVLSELANFLGPQRLAPPAPGSPQPSAAAPALDKEYEMLLDALGFEPASIDVLVARTGLPSESIASMLLILELEGRVAPHPGGRYSRVARR